MPTILVLIFGCWTEQRAEEQAAADCDRACELYYGVCVEANDQDIGFINWNAEDYIAACQRDCDGAAAEGHDGARAEWTECVLEHEDEATRAAPDNLLSCGEVTACGFGPCDVPSMYHGVVQGEDWRCYP